MMGGKVADFRFHEYMLACSGGSMGHEAQKNRLAARQIGLTRGAGMGLWRSRLSDSPELERLQLPISSYERDCSPWARQQVL
jgi:hypothetical protein